MAGSFNRCLPAVALLVLPCVLVRAETAQGMLQVSVTVVATCDVKVIASAQASVSCPQDHPYRVSLAPPAQTLREAAATAGDGLFNSGASVVALAQLPDRQSRLGETNVSDRRVTVLTISY